MDKRHIQSPEANKRDKYRKEPSHASLASTGVHLYPSDISSRGFLENPSVQQRRSPATTPISIGTTLSVSVVPLYPRRVWIRRSSPLKRRERLSNAFESGAEPQRGKSSAQRFRDIPIGESARASRAGYRYRETGNRSKSKPRLRSRRQTVLVRARSRITQRTG